MYNRCRGADNTKISCNNRCFAIYDGSNTRTKRNGFKGFAMDKTKATFVSSAIAPCEKLPKYLEMKDWSKNNTTGSVSSYQESMCSKDSEGGDFSFASHSGYDEVELLKLYKSYLKRDTKSPTFKKIELKLGETKRNLLDTLLKGCRDGSV